MKILRYILVALLLAILAYLISSRATASMPYVRGEFGVHCYTDGEEHGNIRYLVRYASLEECKEAAKHYEESN